MTVQWPAKEAECPAGRNHFYATSSLIKMCQARQLLCTCDEYTLSPVLDDCARGAQGLRSQPTACSLPLPDIVYLLTMKAMLPCRSPGPGPQPQNSH